MQNAYPTCLFQGRIFFVIRLFGSRCSSLIVFVFVVRSESWSSSFILKNYQSKNEHPTQTHIDVELYVHSDFDGS